MNHRQNLPEVAQICEPTHLNSIYECGRAIIIPLIILNEYNIFSIQEQPVSSTFIQIWNPTHTFSILVGMYVLFANERD
jgi:hypothetical protein